MTFFERSYEARFCFDGSMSIHLLSCIGICCCRPNEFSRLRVFFLPLTWLQPRLCLFVKFALLVDLQEFLCYLNRIDHVFDRSKGNSDPRMRIVLIHGLNSNFNSIFEVLKTGRDFQYRSNPHISLNPSFWLRSWIISR